MNLYVLKTVISLKMWCFVSVFDSTFLNEHLTSLKEFVDSG